MDTPTRERIEALEQRVKELEGEVAELRSKLGAVTSGPSWSDIKKNNPPFAEEIDRQIKQEIKPIKHESTTAGESWK